MAEDGKISWMELRTNDEILEMVDENIT